jgi:hypothetical protein
MKIFLSSKIIWCLFWAEFFSSEFSFSQTVGSDGGQSRGKKDLPIIIFGNNFGLNPRKIPNEQIEASKFGNVPIIQTETSQGKSNKLGPLKLRELTIETQKNNWFNPWIKKTNSSIFER